MLLLGKPLASCTSDDICKLVDDGISESKTLDYKRQLNLDRANENNNQDFVSDIVSFANTEGGVILVGIDEQRDGKGKPNGLPESIVGLEAINVDQLTTQIEDRIRNYVEPHIDNLMVKSIQVDDKTVLGIGVPKRLGRPHMVTFREVNLFFKRNNNGKYRLGYNEVWSEFQRGEERQKQIVEFIEARYSKGLPFPSAPPQYDKMGTLFLHVVPMSRFGEHKLNLTLDSERGDIVSHLNPMGSSLRNQFYNLEGFLLQNQYHTGKGFNYSHVQVFRDYSLEYATNMCTWWDGDGKMPTHVLDERVDNHVILSFAEGMRYYIRKSIEPPYYVQVSLRNVHGLQLASHKVRDFGDVNHNFSAESIVLPPLVLYSVDKHTAKEFKPLFDFLFQTANYEQSPSEYTVLPRFG